MGRGGKQIPEVPSGARRQWAADRVLRPPMRSPGRPEPSHAVQRDFWRRIASGVTTVEASEAVGVSWPVGARWFRHADLICDRVRAINRLRATLLEYFPALERREILQEQGRTDTAFGLSDAGWVAPHRNFQAHRAPTGQHFPCVSQLHRRWLLLARIRTKRDNWFRNFLATHIRTAIAGGSIRNDVEPEIVALALLDFSVESTFK